MIVVGELINASRKKIAAAIRARDRAAIEQVAKDEAAAGAAFIDVNAGVFEDEEAAHLVWLVQTVQQAVDVPCSIDSPNPAVLQEVLPQHQGPALVNSVSLESGRLEPVTSILAGTEHRVIALCMTDEGMPETVDDRLAAAERLINHLVKHGVAEPHIFVDPLVQPLSTNGEAPMRALGAIEAMRKRFPEVHGICGLSNVSFGLPKRKLLNRTFLAMGIARGLDAAILNPLDAELQAVLYAAEALAGRDAWCERYLDGYREKRF